MAEATSVSFPSSVLRNLPDKLYEKRKAAALEVENVIRSLAAADESAKILSLIMFLVNDFVTSPQAVHRQGGLLGLAAVTVGLQDHSTPFLKNIIPPVLQSLVDQDSRVRYSGCEALYNIAKVARENLIVFFNNIFDALCKLSVDTDPDVQRAANLLNRFIKDIVSGSDDFSVEEFVPLLRERMNILNPFVRCFLVDWITTLDNVPQIDMTSFLPDFLDGLFNMLSDSPEIRQQADSALSEFLQDIETAASVDYCRIVKILVQHARSRYEFTRLTAVTWINKFVKMCADQLVSEYEEILGAILSAVSDADEKIRIVARETNNELRANAVQGFDIGCAVHAALRELKNESELTKLEALRWIYVLLERHTTEVFSFLDDIFPALLEALSDESKDVVLLVLEVQACIARDPQQFHRLMVFLLLKFQMNKQLLERRGGLILRHICVILDPEAVYRQLAAILEAEANLEFARMMVQALNLILLTAPELKNLRYLLRQYSTSPRSKAFFLVLQPSWCHSSVATIGLCLLAQAYDYASTVIQALEEQDFNVSFYVQLDKLVRLLEAPVFATLRLQLLKPEGKSPLKVLYDLLMLLPQESVAYKILWNRLKTVPNSQSMKFAGEEPVTEVDLRQKFQMMLQQHRSYSES